MLGGFTVPLATGTSGCPWALAWGANKVKKLKLRHRPKLNPKLSENTDTGNVDDFFASLLIDVLLDALIDSVVQNVVGGEWIFNLIA